MRWIWWAVFFSSCLAGCASTTLSTVADQARQQGFEGVLWVAEGDRVLLQQASGPLHQGRSQDGSLRVDSPVRLASISKTMTAVAVMQQVQAGRWRLDDALGQHWPDFPQAAAHGITLRQLLNHTSGLPNPDTQADFYKADRQPPPSVQDDALAACSGPPTAAPGARFEYNNCDYLVLGALLQRVRQQPLAQVLTEAVLVPAGLRATRLQTANDIGLPTQVQGSWQDKPGDARRFDGPRNVARYHGSGGLIGTVPEVGQWAQALLKGRLLGPEALREMTTPNPSGAALSLWAYTLPAVDGAPALRVWERQGWIGGVRWLLLMTPEPPQRVVVVMSTRGEWDLSQSWQGQGLGVQLLGALRR